MTMRKINFDMDGTLVDLYNTEPFASANLDKPVELENGDCYRNAEPLVNPYTFNRVCEKLREKGWEINVISWNSKSGNEKLHNDIKNAKMEWIDKMGMKFDNIHILPYGTPKSQYGTDLLFDDNEEVREEWEKENNGAFTEVGIIETLERLVG